MKSILDGREALAREVEQVAEVAGYLWQKGWAERNGGNITVNVTEYVDDEIRSMPAIAEPVALGQTLSNLKGCYFFCKGTNKRMRDLARRPMENGSIIRILEDCASYVIIADNVVKPTWDRIRTRESRTRRIFLLFMSNPSQSFRRSLVFDPLLSGSPRRRA